MQEDIQFIEDPGGMNALFREARERTEARLKREFYVALNLEQLPLEIVWDKEKEAEGAAADMPSAIHHEGANYYHLTLPHFAWLHSRMKQAKTAHASGKLSEAAWATAKMLWRELLDKANRAYGRETLEAAVKSFKPGRYRLPEPPVPKAKRASDGIPASCPYTREYLEKAAKEHPDIVPCPATKNEWWWVEIKWCRTKCRLGHSDCIKKLFWPEPSAEEGGVQ